MKHLSLSFFTCLMLFISSATAESVYLPITIRDFDESHSDFEAFPEQTGKGCGTVKTDGVDAKGEEKQVSYTPGMVEDELKDGKPVRAKKACANDNFDEWFETIKGTNLEFKDSLELESIGNNQFQISIRGKVTTDDHADGIYEGGFFPLDKYKDSETFTKQNPALWCPPSGWKHSLCSDTDNKLVEFHNYGFTIEGQLSFDYTGGEVFSFLGDDDMWIFIDEKLVVDLGGVHLSVKGEVKLDDLAEKNGWEKNSVHTMQFFYAERQSEGSNLTITTTLNNIQELSDSPLKVTKAEKFGNSTSYVFLNTLLSSSTLEKINDGDIPDVFKLNVDGYKFEVTGIQSVVSKDSEKKDGVKYLVTWKTGDGFGVPTTGDSISLKTGNSSVKSVLNKKVEEESWVVFGGATSTSTEEANVEVVPVVNKKEFDFSQLNQGIPSSGKLNEDQGVDWVITPIPLNVRNASDGQKVQEFVQGKNGFGISSEGKAGVVKNGIDGSSSALCIYEMNEATKSQGKSGFDVSSCLDFSFVVQGPFKIKLRMFSHTGTFVREAEVEMTLEDFLKDEAIWKGTKSAIVIPYPKILVNAGIYPTPEASSQLGTGVYVVQVDLLEEHFEKVQYENDDGRASGTDEVLHGRRSNSVKRLPYRRPSKK